MCSKWDVEKHRVSNTIGCPFLKSPPLCLAPSSAVKTSVLCSIMDLTLKPSAMLCANVLMGAKAVEEAPSRNRRQRMSSCGPLRRGCAKDLKFISPFSSNSCGLRSASWRCISIASRWAMASMVPKLWHKRIFIALQVNSRVKIAP